MGPSLVASTSRPPSPESPAPPREPEEEEEEKEEEKPAYDEQVYDDVMPLHRSTSYDQIPLVLANDSDPPPEILEKIEAKKEEEEETLVDEDVYDDVGLPIQSSSQESHERVNSLYAGSSLAGSIQMAYSSYYYDKESEWEDEDAELYGLESG